jgi:hypothetical protein
MSCLHDRKSKKANVLEILKRRESNPERKSIRAKNIVKMKEIQLRQSFPKISLNFQLLLHSSPHKQRNIPNNRWLNLKLKRQLLSMI